MAYFFDDFELGITPEELTQEPEITPELREIMNEDTPLAERFETDNNLDWEIEEAQWGANGHFEE